MGPAIAQLGKASPSDVSDAELRKEIARAARDVVDDTSLDSGLRRDAMPLLVTWGSTYSVPIFIRLLEDKNHDVQLDALGVLAKMQDPQAIEPLVETFVKDPLLRKDAANCLRSFGSDAEDVILQSVSPSNFLITQATVQLLGDIGTRKSIDRMRLLRKLYFYKMVQQDVTDAIAKIRRREAEANKSS